jgi:uncharacterized protein (TIGR03086 family)
MTGFDFDDRSMTSTDTDPSAPTSRRPIPIDFTDGRPLRSDDPRTAMARAAHLTRAVIAEVDDGNANNHSPCTDWNAADIARHIIAVVDRCAAGPSGRVLGDMPILADVAVGSLDETLAESAHQLQAAWTDDALDAEINVPWGVVSGAEALGTYTGELILHAWDLAVAIGVEPAWPEPDTSIALRISRTIVPAEGRGDFMPFNDAVDPGPSASPIEQLAGWMGRDVHSWR